MATDWNKLKVVDLKSELKRLGLPQNGLKADLVARLEAADSERAASQSSDETLKEVEAVNGEVQPVEIAPEATGAPEVSESSPPDESPKQSETEAEAEAVPAQEVSAPAVIETQVALESSVGETPLQITELIQDSQKRKRRSLSPAPSADEVAHKRARQESRDIQEDDRVASSTEEKVDAVVEPQEEKKESVNQTPPDIEMEGVQDEAPIEREHSNGVAQSTPADDANRDVQNGHAVEVVTNKTQATFEESPEDEPPREQPYTAHPAEIERDVEPSIHPATSALYIKNFMRPLRPQAVKEHLLDLATPMGTPVEDGTIVDFYLDTIRTHAFVVFNTISSASRVRTALHNRVWPDETNRKALWVDFIPSERFAEWVDMEQTSTGGRGSTNRYEVMYDNDEDGNVIVKLEEFDGAGPTTKQTPLAPEPQPERKPSIPTGPSRPFPGVEGAPTGPRNLNSTRAPASHPSRAGRLEQPGQSTNARPSVTYQPVPDELVRRRLDTIAAAKTKDFDRDFGKEYKRYYFENGETLVDRGPEIFLGIRPPHRERQREREQRREPGREPVREPAREPGRGRRGGGRRRGGMPIFHGVPRGGDRFRPGDSSASGPNGRSRYADDRGSRRDGHGHGHGRERPSRRDSYSRY
ncbi:hypothetical protein F5Y00DRAFT_157812 [Daldinia vernicosa]|uniref:uncharacterized protein n=1 Tax=Daldinia vernicosa TaxID=114800 RepID=UPI0020077860|nr:uncharacterized protein F5Y00DRAFT_157812 [Daldinia vernicosa]KAI0852970.1 hypothetical protein F5Y00DRAFT_157812 [Daldinia vernicosa]